MCRVMISVVVVSLLPKCNQTGTSRVLRGETVSARNSGELRMDGKHERITPRVMSVKPRFTPDDAAGCLWFSRKMKIDAVVYAIASRCV